MKESFTYIFYTYTIGYRVAQFMRTLHLRINSQGGGEHIYCHRQTNCLIVSTLQCGKTREKLQAEIETWLALRQSDILLQSYRHFHISVATLRIGIFKLSPNSYFLKSIYFKAIKYHLKTSHLSMTLVGLNNLTRTIINYYFNSLSLFVFCCCCLFCFFFHV